MSSAGWRGELRDCREHTTALKRTERISVGRATPPIKVQEYERAGGRTNLLGTTHPMKPPLKTKSSDDFQTPPQALVPLLPYLKSEWTIWEPASGNGNLVKELSSLGFQVSASDILTGDDFLLVEKKCDCIITNPPYSLKQEFLERCYALRKPFALLMPLTALETAKRQNLYRKHGIEIILMPKRVNFETSSGKGKSSWFATAWFTNGLEIGRQLTFSSCVF